MENFRVFFYICFHSFVFVLFSISFFICFLKQFKTPVCLRIHIAYFTALKLSFSCACFWRWSRLCVWFEFVKMFFLRLFLPFFFFAVMCRYNKVLTSTTTSRIKAIMKNKSWHEFSAVNVKVIQEKNTICGI